MWGQGTPPVPSSHTTWEPVQGSGMVQGLGLAPMSCQYQSQPSHWIRALNWLPCSARTETGSCARLALLAASILHQSLELVPMLCRGGVLVSTPSHHTILEPWNQLWCNVGAELAPVSCKCYSQSPHYTSALNWLWCNPKAETENQLWYKLFPLKTTVCPVYVRADFGSFASCFIESLHLVDFLPFIAFIRYILIFSQSWKEEGIICSYL